MPNNENYQALIEELQNETVQRALIYEEWREEDINKFKLQLSELAKQDDWKEQYLKDHLAENCVLEALHLECEKIELVLTEVTRFLNHLKNDVKKLKDSSLLYELINEMIQVCYPNSRLEMLFKAIKESKAKTIETALFKGVKRVIAEAIAETFQGHLQACCDGVRDPKCLCLLIQTLMDSGLDYESISRILGKTNQGTRKLWQRCQENMAQHQELYRQNHQD